MSTDCKCPICLDTPVDSRQLTCGHSLCLSCCRVVNQKIVCSLCRKPTCVNSAEELPSTSATPSDKLCSECDNPATVYCAECSAEGVFLCEEHNTVMHLMKSRKNHHVDPISSSCALSKKESKKVKKCVQHNLECELWCSDCKKPVCSHCLHSSVHKDHSFSVLNDQQEVNPDARVLAKKQEELDREMELQKAIELRLKQILELQLQLVTKETELSANKAITEKMDADIQNAYATLKHGPTEVTITNRKSADVRMLNEQKKKTMKKQMIKSTEVDEQTRQVLQTQHEADELKKKITVLKKEVAKIKHEASLEESSKARMKAAKKVQEIKLKQRPVKVVNSPFVRFNTMIYKTITGNRKSPRFTPKKDTILSVSLELMKSPSMSREEKPTLQAEDFSIYQPMVEQFKYEFFAIKSLFDQLLDFNKRAPLAPPKPVFSVFYPIVEKYRFLQIQSLFEQLLQTSNNTPIAATPAVPAVQSKEQQESTKWFEEAKRVGPSPPPKPVWIPGSSKIEYKRYMICRYEHEAWENSILLLSRKLKQAQVYSYKSN